MVIPGRRREHWLLPCYPNVAANPGPVDVFEEASDSILVGLQLLADSLQLLQDDVVIHLQNLSA
jgi:hypothetical protein